MTGLEREDRFQRVIAVYPCNPVPKLCKRICRPGREGYVCMVRSELVAKLAETYPHLTPREGEKIVATIFGEIAAALSRGDKVELRGFGSFSVKYLNARVWRSPKTGAKVGVPAKCFPHFRTGAPMSARLNSCARSDAS